LHHHRRPNLDDPALRAAAIPLSDTVTVGSHSFCLLSGYFEFVSTSFRVLDFMSWRPWPRASLLALWLLESVIAGQASETGAAPTHFRCTVVIYVKRLTLLLQCRADSHQFAMVALGGAPLSTLFGMINVMRLAITFSILR